MKNKGPEEVMIYQAKCGAIEFRGDLEQDTMWGNLNQVAALFNVQKPAISKHLKNIYKEEELNKEATVSILEIVQTEGKRRVTRKIEYYNLDAILSVGYRVNSRQATQFRIWATKTLKQHLLNGYTINKKRIGENYKKFSQTVEDIKKLSVKNTSLKTDDVLELVKTFARAWFSLETYDKQTFPQKGFTRKDLKIQSEDLYAGIATFKAELVKKGEAPELFAQEKSKGTMGGIIGNVFQSAFGQDAYPSIEEKAAHLFYFTVKNHPFNDGNKRTGAFSFIWFLQKAGLQFQKKITPETLTALTLLIAESDPRKKDKMVGLVLLLLKD